MKHTEMKVELIDIMGTDLSVVNSARVSFNKQSSSDEWYEMAIDQAGFAIPALNGDDHKLIKYLAENKHWTPFAHTALSFRIKCPIFVARQLGKSQVGLVWNEVSRRYVDFEPEFWFPTEWRTKSKNKKQGSSSKIITNDTLETTICGVKYEDWSLNGCGHTPREAAMIALETYNLLLNENICPEQARMVLPQNMMTEFIWTGSLFAFARICSLRSADDTQLETRLGISDKIFPICDKAFPISWYHLMNKQFPDKEYEINSKE
jgi:thymidylate synthase (FAD)